MDKRLSYKEAAEAARKECEARTQSAWEMVVSCVCEWEGDRGGARYAKNERYRGLFRAGFGLGFQSGLSQKDRPTIPLKWKGMK